MMSDTALLVLGLGSPHDEIVAAACRAFAPLARSGGPLDGDAEARGRDALPRGACAPLLYTTGALLRARDERADLTVLSLGSCGPCRYATFEAAWQRALAIEGRPPVRVLGLPQSRAGLLAWVDSATGRRLLEAVATADALVAARNRALPYARRPAAVDAAMERATLRVATAITTGVDPLVALATVRGWERVPPRCTPRVVARVRLLGDPWSLHANGDGQLHVPSVLAPLGIEVVAPPSLLWARYCLWLARSDPWGSEPAPTVEQAAHLRAVDERIVETWKAACGALGLVGVALPDPEWLARLARPFLPPSLRGGYGHVEIGLARDAVLAGDTHALVSVKSFGCMPSSGVSDAIVTAAIDDAMPFLALEVCADGQAARESRLTLLAAEALRRATCHADRAPTELAS